MNLKNWRRRSTRAVVLTIKYTLRSSPSELLALFEVDFRLPTFYLL